jgi:hypothetical protein
VFGGAEFENLASAKRLNDERHGGAMADNQRGIRGGSHREGAGRNFVDGLVAWDFDLTVGAPRGGLAKD